MRSKHVVSLSLNKSMNPKHQKDFYTKELTIKELSEVIMKENWSPCVWENGVRFGKNFVSASLMAFDFDSGIWTLEDAKAYFCSTKAPFILATTKSHQKQKGESPPCDRFRVIVCADECTSMLDYVHTMKLLCSELPCDNSCTDAARFFWRSVGDVAVFSGEDGGLFHWSKFVEERKFFYRRGTKSPLDWPKDVSFYLTSRVEVGGRHKACYRIGAALARHGYTEEEVFELCNGSVSLMGIGADEVRRQIEYGFRAAAADYEEYCKGQRDSGAVKENGSNTNN